MTETEQVAWVIALFGSGFLLGWLLALRQEYWYIKMKAKKEWRTAMCVDGQFLYVVPEDEYCALQSFIVNGTD